MSGHNLTKTLPLLLATESKYKKQVLEKIGIPFICESPNIDETPKDGELPQALVARLAIEKASALVNKYHNNYIIAADQVASFNNKVLGKPSNKTNAKAQLQQFSGKSVLFLTGLALYDFRTNQMLSHVETFEVIFRPLQEEEIENYLEYEKPYDCAGSFKSEGLGILLFSELKGRDPNSLIGLPLIALFDLFQQININLLEYIESK